MGLRGQRHAGRKGQLSGAELPIPGGEQAAADGDPTGIHTSVTFCTSRTPRGSDERQGLLPKKQRETKICPVSPASPQTPSLLRGALPHSPHLLCSPRGETWWPKPGLASHRSGLMATVQGGYDRRSNGGSRLQPDFPNLAISMGQRGGQRRGQAGLLFAFQLKPLVTGRRRPALVRKTECSRQGRCPSCLPQTSGADTAPGGRGARDFWTLWGTSRPAGETVKERQTGPKQETTDSKP